MNTPDPIARITQHFNDSIEAKQQSLDILAPAIAAAAADIKGALEHGGKLLSCFNGGSAADEQHVCSVML